MDRAKLHKNVFYLTFCLVTFYGARMAFKWLWFFEHILTTPHPPDLTAEAYFLAASPALIVAGSCWIIIRATRNKNLKKAWAFIVLEILSLSLCQTALMVEIARRLG